MPCSSGPAKNSGNIVIRSNRMSLEVQCSEFNLPMQVSTRERPAPFLYVRPVSAYDWLGVSWAHLSSFASSQGRTIHVLEPWLNESCAGRSHIGCECPRGLRRI